MCGAGCVRDGDFLHLTLCLASYLPSYNPFQPHTCSLLVSHSTFFTLSPPRTPSLTCYLSADLLSPSHRALSLPLALALSLHAFSTRTQMQPSGQGEKMKKKCSVRGCLSGIWLELTRVNAWWETFHSPRGSGGLELDRSGEAQRWCVLRFRPFLFAVSEQISLGSC